MLNDENELLHFVEKCYAESNYKEGFDAIEENNSLIYKKYYEITKYKLLFLIAMEKLIEALVLIKEELSVPYVPRDFESFLKDKQQEINFLLRDKQHHSLTIEELENIDKLDNENLLSLLPHLKDFNLNLLIQQFQNIFNNFKITNVTKSLLIALLSDYQLDHTFEIVKENTKIKFNPKSVFDIRDSENFIYMENELEKLQFIEINLQELIHRLIVMYLLDIYPLVITQQNCDEIIAVSIKMANEMSNGNLYVEKYEKIYMENVEKSKKIYKKLNNLLESI